MELAQRFLFAQGWNPMPNGITYAWQAFSEAGSGFVQHRNGDGQLPVPGDLIIWNANVGWGAGHIAVVDYVSGNTVHYVQQNTPSPTDSRTIVGGRWDDPNIVGFLHDTKNPNTNGGTPTPNGGGGSVSVGSSPSAVIDGASEDIFYASNGALYEESFSGGSWHGPRRSRT